MNTEVGQAVAPGEGFDKFWRSTIAAPAAIFLAAFIVYLRTLCGTFNINDSGETIAQGYNFWIGHSPGYPLHTTLARMFCALPFSNPMFQVSLASATCAALTVAILPKVLALYGFSPLALALGTGTFALSENFWFQACGAKGGIYTLGILLMVLVLWAVEKLNREPTVPRRWMVVGFLISLMLGHHWQSMAFGPALAILAWPGLKRVWDHPQRMLAAVPLLLLGATPILVLPLRAIHPLTLNWGEPSRWVRLDPSRKQVTSGLKWTLAREGYKGIGDVRGWDTIGRNLKRFGNDFLDQYMIPAEAGRPLAKAGLFLLGLMAVWGLAILWRRSSRISGGLFCLGFAVAGAVVLYTNSKAGYEWVIDNFFGPFYFLVSVAGGLGLASMIEVVGRAAAFGKGGRGVLAAAGFAALVGGTGLSNLPRCAQRNYLLSWDYGHNILKSTPPGALIMCAGDIDVLPLWYLRYVEGQRPDIQVVTCQLLPYDWYRRSIAREDSRSALPMFGDMLVPMEAAGEMLMRAALQHGRPVVYTFIYTRPFMQKFPSRVRGIVWEVVPDSLVHAPYDIRENDRLFADFRLRGVMEPEVYKDDYTQVLVDSYGTARDAAGFVALREAGDAATPAHARESWYRTAIHEFKRAFPLRSPQAQSAIRANMGAAYRGLGDYAGALAQYQEAAALGSADPVLHYNYGITLLQVGRASEAGAQFRACVAKTTDPNLIRLSGIELQKLGDQQGLEQAVSKFRMLAPQQAPGT